MITCGPIVIRAHRCSWLGEIGILLLQERDNTLAKSREVPRATAGEPTHRFGWEQVIKVGIKL